MAPNRGRYSGSNSSGADNSFAGKIANKITSFVSDVESLINENSNQRKDFRNVHGANSKKTSTKDSMMKSMRTTGSKKGR